MRFRRARTWGRGSILRKRRYPSSARRDCSSVVLSLPARRRSFEERSSRNPCRPSPQDQAPLYVQHGKDAGIQKRACGLLTGILDNHRRPLLHRGMRTCLPHPIGQARTIVCSREEATSELVLLKMDARLLPPEIATVETAVGPSPQADKLGCRHISSANAPIAGVPLSVPLTSHCFRVCLLA